MRVTIHGPNLLDQSKGQFHVHAEDCRDNEREIMRNGSERPWTVEVATRRDAVYAIYADQISEGASYASCHSDLHFHPCCRYLSDITGAPMS